MFFDNPRGGGGGGFGGGNGTGFGGGNGGLSGNGTGGTNAGGKNVSQTRQRLVHVAVVSAAESMSVTLVAVFADGRRVYMTSLPSVGYGGGRYGGAGAVPYGGGASTQNGQSGQRGKPCPPVSRLAVVAVRDPPPQSSATRGMTSAQALRAATTARPLEVEAAYYAEGVMLLSDAAETDEDARLFVASRDNSLPSHLRQVTGLETAAGGGNAFAHNAGVSMPTHNSQPNLGAEGAGYAGGGGGERAHAARSLREAVTTRRLTGRAASSVGSMGEVPPPPAAMRDLDPPFPQGAGSARPGLTANKPHAAELRGSELATQHVAPRRKFVLVTNAGVVLIEKARPVDALRELLLDDVHEHLMRFFGAYGQAEAATMCLAVALGACAETPAGRSETDGRATGARVGAGADVGDFFSARTATPAAAAACAERARLALEDPRLTGEPRVEEDVDTVPVREQTGLTPTQTGRFDQFDMGRAIVQPRMHFSGVHAACYTYAARLLAAAWERPVATILSVSARDGGSLGNGMGTHGANAGVPKTVSGLASHARRDRQPLREAVANGAATNGAVGAASAAAGWLGGMLRPGRNVGAPVVCTLPPDALWSLEQRLRPLERFLARRRPRVFSQDENLAAGRSPNLTGQRAYDPRDPKRRRVDPGAARRAEELSLAALRGTLRRAAEASALLRIAGEVGFARVAANLSRTDADALVSGDCTLRLLATSAGGARLASAIVEALMSSLVASGDVAAAEVCAERLQHSCPLFFGGEERRFYRAREQLQCARDARDARDVLLAETKTTEALVALLEVPNAGNLSATLAELADAGCFHGLVALPLCAAAASRRVRGYAGEIGDGENSEAFFAEGALFSPFDPEQRDAGQKAFDDVDRSNSVSMTASSPETCREFICVALRALALGTPDEGAPPGSLGAVCASLSPATRARGLAAMLERVAQASSPSVALAARARLVAVAAEAEAAAAAAARAGAPFLPPPSARNSAALVASVVEQEGASLDDDAFVRRVYQELIALDKDTELLSLPPGPLEQYLAEKGAFAVAQQGGALTQGQAKHLELLAKLYASKVRIGPFTKSRRLFAYSRLTLFFTIEATGRARGAGVFRARRAERAGRGGGSFGTSRAVRLGVHQSGRWRGWHQSRQRRFGGIQQCRVLRPNRRRGVRGDFGRENKGSRVSAKGTHCISQIPTLFAHTRLTLFFSNKVAVCVSGARARCGTPLRNRKRRSCRGL